MHSLITTTCLQDKRTPLQQCTREVVQSLGPGKKPHNEQSQGFPSTTTPAPPPLPPPPDTHTFIYTTHMHAAHARTHARSTRGSQQQRGVSTYVTPISPPTVCSCRPMSDSGAPRGLSPCPRSSVSSVGKGPEPTRVVYAFTTPTTFSIFWGDLGGAWETATRTAGEGVEQDHTGAHSLGPS